MMLRRSCTWILKPSGKVMNLEVEICNGILLIMNDGVKFDWLEHNHIILRKFMIIYLSLDCKVS